MDGGIGLAKIETAATVADVENNAALFCVEEIRADFTVGVEHRNVVNVHVRGAVARAKFLCDELFVGAFGAEDAEVHHDGNLRGNAGFESVIHSGPFRRFEVGSLDADDEAGELLGHRRSGGGVHVTCVLLGGGRTHAAADDVEKGEDAGFGAVNHAIFEVGKILVAGAAGIGNGRYATAEGETVGIDAVIAIIGVAEAGAGVDMGVNVNEAGSEVEAFGVDGFGGVRRRDIFFDSGDFVVADGNVTDFVEIVLWVEDGGAFDKEVVFFLSEERGGKEEEEQKSLHGLCKVPFLCSLETI